MKIELKKITNKLFLLIFATQHDITSTFLRFQEFYESPKFRGELFTLGEFKQWYKENSQKGKKTGEFTYYSDWNGFNIPSSILKPFYNGRFNPLSEKEKKLLDFFKRKKSRFYIIGVHRGTKEVKNLLIHELAHGLFYIDKNYKKEVLYVLNIFNLDSLRKELALKGYHEKVLEDECHAYALSPSKKMKIQIPKKLKEKLTDIFKKYLEKNKIRFQQSPPINIQIEI